MHTSLRNTPALSVAFILIAGAISICNGDDGPSRTLFGNKAVQRELNLTVTQQKQVEAIVLEIETKIANAKNEAAKTTKDPRVAKRIIGDLEARVVDEAGRQFMELLDQKQADRFWQIGAQCAGIQVFGNNRVQRVLQLSDVQKKAMNEHLDRMVEEVTNLATNADLDIATVQKRAEVAKQECFARMLEVLNEGQKKDFFDLLGKPFDVKLLMSN